MRIEYSTAVLDEIRVQAVDGLNQFKHGGLEIGGILFGTHENGVVRILAHRRVECRYSAGPSFTLSAAERAEFEETLRAPAADPDLFGLQPVGWYHSHTRKAINLSEADLEFHNSYFRQPWQVALVVKPDHFGPATAGFFVREPDGSIAASASYQEFTIQPSPGARFRTRRTAIVPPAGTGELPGDEPVPAPEPVAEAVEATPAPLDAPAEARPDFASEPPAYEPAEQAQTEPAAIAEFEPPPRRRRALWLVAAALLIAAVIFVFLTRRPPAAQPSLALQVHDVDGQLQIGWDRNAKAVIEAAGGTLEIVDGQSRLALPFDTTRLKQGSVTYARRSDTVDIRLRVRVADGRSAEEFIRYVAPAPAVQAPPEPKPLETAAKAPETLAPAEPAPEAARPKPEPPPVQPVQAESANAVGSSRDARKLVQPLPQAVAAKPVVETRPEAPQPVPRQLAQFRPPQARSVRPVPAPIAAAVPQVTFHNGTTAPLPVPQVKPPEAAPAPAPAAAPAPVKAAEAQPARPTYTGPSSGRLIWTGQVRRGVPITIEGGHASYGSLIGSLPGVPVRVAAYPADLSGRGLVIFSANPAHARARQEAPGPQNGWNPTTYSLDPKKANQVIVAEAPGPQNGWKGLSLSGESDRFSVVVIEWRVER